MFGRKNRLMKFELAMSDAKGAIFSTRAGDAETDVNLGGTGVRIIVNNFGNFMPFILGERTKDWLMKAYELSERQAEDVYRLLVSRAKAELREHHQKMSRYERKSSASHPYINWLKQKTTWGS